MSKCGLRTLVLNSNYLPINLLPLKTIPAEDALTRVFNETCHVVSEFDRRVKTANREMNINWPAVIARNSPETVKNSLKLTDENLYFRDHGMCQYCEKKFPLSNITLDHVIPKSKGGISAWTNLVCACGPCNSKKDDQMPVGLWKPRKMPLQPTYHQLLQNRRKFPIVVDSADWIPFIGEWQAPIQVRHA